jgi:hypothetical protein
MTKKAGQDEIDCPLSEEQTAKCKDRGRHSLAGSAAQKDAFVGMLETACRQIEERSSFSAAEIESWLILDDLRISPRGSLKVSAGPVVEVGQAIGALMIGHVLEPPSGHELVYGAPTV